jgi:hypothetical protein
MYKKSILILCGLAVFTLCQAKIAVSEEYYRTFEIIGKSENSLTLQDSDGNVIEVNEDPAGFQVGYKVRYDSIRKRLRHYRWQDYEVIAVTDNAITMRHKTGAILSVAGNYTREFKVGDQVRYDSVGEKLVHDEGSGQWKQYTVVVADEDKITLRGNDGQEIILHLDNNIYQAPRGLFIANYKVGDDVRYNAATNKIKKGIIRTYDWQDYVVKEANGNQIVLTGQDNEDLVLKNTYGGNYKAGDKVKFDRLNNLLKKAR